jgi:hypothetical protein
MALSGASAGFSAINNGFGVPNLVNGFDKNEKWDVLERGSGTLSAGPADISNALSTGPYSVPPGGRALVVYALLAGSDLADLQANADRAQEFYSDSLLTDTSEIPGARLPVLSLGAPVPNPFNPMTRISLDVRAARSVDVGVYDARGRRLRTLVAGTRAPGRYVLEWDGADESGTRVASGVYFARLRSGELRQVRRLVLAK